jgi:uncharacterized sulfatase
VELNLNMKKDRNFLGNMMSNLIPKDIIIYYTFLAVLGKNILLLCFMLDSEHIFPRVRSALNVLSVANGFRVLYYIAFSLLITWFLLLFKNRLRFMMSIIVNFLCSFLMLVDIWYLRGFNTLPTIHMLQASGNMTESMSSFFGLISWIDILFVIDIPVLLVIFFVKKGIYRKVQANIILSALLLIFSLASFFYLAPAVSATSSKPVHSDRVFSKFDAVNTADNISPLGYGIYSSYKFFADKKTISLSKSEREKIAQWYKDKKENLPDNEYKGMFKGKNLLVIQVESLEKFELNNKINGQEVTPNINKIMKNSLFFSDVHEQVGGGNSSDADLMTNTSVYPIQMGTTFFSNPFTYYNSLPRMLGKLGYYTTAIHPDEGGFWNWMPALKSIGFDKCYDSTSYKIDERINMGISDGSYFKQVEPIIKNEKRPFYTFLVTLSSHTPFDLPAKYRELKLDPELENSKLGGYLQSIHYTDKQLGLLFDRLEKDGVLDNTIVAMYGDHQGIHKYFPQDIEALKNQEAWYKDDKKHIPFIIYNKSLSAKEIKTTGGQIDFLPTLAYLMGIDESSYENTAMGRNLLKTNKSFAVLRNRTVLGNVDAKEKAHAVKGLELADEIIRGNYFKN